MAEIVLHKGQSDIIKYLFAEPNTVKYATVMA